MKIVIDGETIEVAGAPGKNATINGKSAITLNAGENVSIETADDGVVTISASASGGDAIPPGVILAWYGSVESIPDGWAICDGTNNTPDLRGRFVLGASTTHDVGETGGSEEVTLTVEQMPEHDHTYGVARTASSAQAAPYIGYTNQSQVNTSKAGGGQPHPNMPPYYALTYIMKL